MPPRPTSPNAAARHGALTKENFSQQSAILLQSKAQFDTLVALTDCADRSRAIIKAMESIEGDYESLRGVLPKSEYQELDNAVLGQLPRTLNPDELKKVSGDVFGRIYEYFLTRFADQKPHDGGIFFTPCRWSPMCWSRKPVQCRIRPVVPEACSCRAPAWWNSATNTRPRS